MKKEYRTPLAEKLEFKYEEQITASTGIIGGDTGDNGGTGDIGGSGDSGGTGGTGGQPDVGDIVGGIITYLLNALGICSYFD